MKTIDAVNFYQGEWRYNDATSAYYRGTYWYCGSTKNIATEHVCTREEFNQCVEELSKAEWIKPKYVIGNTYEFRDGESDRWEKGFLVSIDEEYAVAGGCYALVVSSYRVV